VNTKKPYLLLILDGWGYREAIEANAIAQAHTPTWDRLWHTAPHALIDASGEAVGLPDQQMGNSEVGHMHLGAGRTIYQDLTLIHHAIKTGEFAKHPLLQQLLQQLLGTPQKLHLIGLLSPGGVHSHDSHFMAFLDMAKDAGVHHKICVHAFLDGRDTPPQSAEASLRNLHDFLQKHQLGCIASICGRFYAMDRDQRWDRVALAYALLTAKQTSYVFENPLSALQAAYARGENDEFVQPTWINHPDANVVQAHDSVLFMNFRADRARELTQAFVSDDFSGFARQRLPLQFATLTEYAENLAVQVVFAPQQIHNTLGECLAQHCKTQLRIAETEKYAHVTYFFNGGADTAFPGETRILIDSPREVRTYDLKPEMSAYEVTEKLINAIHSGEYDALICNFANADMVGHTGNMTAAIKAVEVLDECLQKIITALQAVNGEGLITADHGNIEMLVNPHTHQTHTAHTALPVPVVYLGQRAVRFNLSDTNPNTVVGSLRDIAPTLLWLMDLPIAKEMTGQVLLQPTCT
jgi:2,3-bisphosphoglycerate-independent phosphoglycerate mutase